MAKKNKKRHEIRDRIKIKDIEAREREI